jgi:hypothetical protein
VSAVLASLLPGLREVRAPLSAGFIWLAAIWFLIEPRWPGGASSGIVASANRLLSNLSLLGQGVVISFVAYVLGSFSVFFFSSRLAGQIRTSTRHTGRLSGLSSAARASLEQVARDGRQRLQTELALSGLPVGDVLRQTRPVDFDDQPDRDSRWRMLREHMGQLARRVKFHPRWRRFQQRRASVPILRWSRGVSYERRWWQFWLVDGQKLIRHPVGPTAPRSADELAEDEIAQRVLRDLPVLADAQLLGKENEVFSAVDRNQAEVDFRIALVPAVLALGVSLALAGVPDDAWIGLITVPAGALAAGALILDAARQRRTANELLLSLIEHRRITAPTVSRAAAAASELADQAPAKVVIRRGEAAVRTIRRYMEVVSRVGDSSVLLGPDHWVEAANAARSENAKLEELLHQFRDAIPTSPTGADVMSLVHDAEDVIDGWLQSSTASAAYDPDSVERTNEQLTQVLREADSALGAYAARIRAAVAVAAATDASRASIAAHDTSSADAQGDPA